MGSDRTSQVETMISIITIGFHSEKHMATLKRCIREIREPVQLLFHDNTELNIGLSKAVNLLLHQVRGDLILFCNPDIIFDKSINIMIDSVRQFGVPQTPMYIGHNVDRRFPTTTRILANHLLLCRLFSRFGLNPIERDYLNNGAEVGDWIEQPGGSCLLMKWDDVERIRRSHPRLQFYNERFPVYWNDVDMAMRARRLGIRFVKSSVRVLHEGAVSSRNIDLERRLMLFYSRAGLIGFATKWHLHPRIMKIAFFLDAIVAVMVRMIGRIRHGGDFQSAILKFRASLQ